MYAYDVLLTNPCNMNEIKILLLHSMAYYSGLKI